MPLNRALIVTAAHDRLRADGLAGVSMRRLAQDLGVQAGALYYHVASKQELLAAVAERILADLPPLEASGDPAAAAVAIRNALLDVRDSADVISFVHAYHPEALTPFQALERVFATRLSPRRAHRAARTLISYVLGFVAEEQNRAELVRAKLVDETGGGDYTVESFRYGVDVILRGLEA